MVVVNAKIIGWRCGPGARCVEKRGGRTGPCIITRAPCTRLNGVADVTFLSQGPQFGIEISAHRPAMALNIEYAGERNSRS